MAEPESFDLSEVRQYSCAKLRWFSFSCALCETYSFGSLMIKVQTSRIMCSQLERAAHLTAKSYMWNTMTQLGLSSELSLPKSSDEKRDKYQAAVVQKNQN